MESKKISELEQYNGSANGFMVPGVAGGETQKADLGAMVDKGAGAAGYVKSTDLKTVNGVPLTGQGDVALELANPFKGYYPAGEAKPGEGAVGDYLYAPPSDAQSTATATLWHYDALQTPPWSDTGIDVSSVVGVAFGSGQPVSQVRIKNDFSGGQGDVLSAEAGRQLSEEVAAINKPDKTVLMDQEGYIKWSTGNRTAVSGYFCSDFVELSGYTELNYTLNAIGTTAANIAFYDADKVFLPEISVRGNSAVQTGDIDLSAAAYEQAVYVRVSEPVADVAGTVVLAANSIIPQIMAGVESLAQDVDGLNDKVDGIVVEDVSADITINGYIKWETGLGTGTSETYKRSDYIGLSGYTDIEYRVGGAISGVAAVVAFYDADKGYLQEVSVRGNSAVRTGRIDLADAAYASARFVRFCAAASLTDAYARLYNRETLSYEVSELERRVSQLDQTGGIKVLIFGDSITDNMGLSVNDTTNCSESCYFRTTDYVNGDGQTVVYKKWPQLLAEFFGTDEVRNYARSGASYKDQTSYTSGENRRRSLSYQITVAENDLSNPNGVFPTEGTYVPDVVVFALGTNDGNPNDTFESAIAKIVYNSEDNVNTSVDVEATLAALDKSKFNEAVMYAFLKVKSMFPTALFMCLLPIQRWSNTAVMGGLHESLKAMANYFSIPVIDGASEMGVVKALEVDSGVGELLKDGLHPNEKGQNVMARMMISQIKSRFVSMAGMNS